MEERVPKNKGAHKPEMTTPPEPVAKHEGGELSPLANLQQTVGNRAVQRLLAQRKGDGAFELDEETDETEIPENEVDAYPEDELVPEGPSPWILALAVTSGAAIAVRGMGAAMLAMWSFGFVD